LTTEPHPPIADTAPTDPRLTDYDRSHFVTYLRLIDAASANAPWEEVARIVLSLDTAAKPDAARRTHESHLARARWLCDHGYRDLLRRVG
jgi:hypothetical protein